MEKIKIDRNKMLLKVYQSLYTHRDLLPDVAHALALDPTGFEPQTLEEATALHLEQNCGRVASYLLGTQNVLDEDELDLIKVIQVHYKDQEFWRDLLYDFVEYLILKEKCAIIEEEKVLLEESKETMLEIFQMEHVEKEIIKTFAEKIKKAGFRVNAEKLIANYLKMRKQDAKQAWSVLTTNPAFFSPIIVKDEMGVVRLSKEAAMDENKKLAKFLKGLKV
ncbi:MAG: hypothetical protein IJY92_01965 [Alphaproteobacteria bacterium]|nr:hypothetical protein [Alphaproteobacteria bacterium]